MQKFESQLFGVVSALLLIACIPLLNYHKGDIVLILNEMHTPALNVIFKIFTAIGDGVIFVPMVLILIGINYRSAILAASVGLVHGLACALFKNVIFSDMMRPKAFFEGHYILETVPGVTLHSQHAFPSGHTATAFALALFLILLIHKKWSFIFLLLAVGVGLSRIYLGQHFYADVVGGAVIGTVSVGFVYWVASFINWPLWSTHGLLVHSSMVTSPELKSPREP